MPGVGHARVGRLDAQRAISRKDSNFETALTGLSSFCFLIVCDRLAFALMTVESGLPIRLAEKVPGNLNVRR